MISNIILVGLCRNFLRFWLPLKDNELISFEEESVVIPYNDIHTLLVLLSLSKRHTLFMDLSNCLTFICISDTAIQLYGAAQILRLITCDTNRAPSLNFVFKLHINCISFCFRTSSRFCNDVSHWLVSSIVLSTNLESALCLGKVRNLLKWIARVSLYLMRIWLLKCHLLRVSILRFPQSSISTDSIPTMNVMMISSSMLQDTLIFT